MTTTQTTIAEMFALMTGINFVFTLVCTVKDPTALKNFALRKRSRHLKNLTLDIVRYDGGSPFRQGPIEISLDSFYRTISIHWKGITVCEIDCRHPATFTSYRPGTGENDWEAYLDEHFSEQMKINRQREREQNRLLKIKKREDQNRKFAPLSSEDFS